MASAMATRTVPVARHANEVPIATRSAGGWRLVGLNVKGVPESAPRPRHLLSYRARPVITRRRLLARGRRPRSVPRAKLETDDLVLQLQLLSLHFLYCCIV